MEPLVLINKQEWQKLNARLASMEELLRSLVQQTSEIVIPTQKGFISIKEAARKYGTSTRTIDERIRIFDIERLQVGRNKLLRESQLIESFKVKGHKPVFLEKKIA